MLRHFPSVLLMVITRALLACDPADTYYITHEGDDADIYNDFDITVVEPTEDDTTEVDTDEDTDIPVDPEPEECIGDDADYPFLPGRPIKGTSLSTVYYYDGEERWVFPNMQTFRTWYPVGAYIETISDQTIANIPIAGNFTVRPGTIAVKTNSSTKTYWVVEGDHPFQGRLRWMESEVVIEEMLGEDWNDRILDIPEVFFFDFDGSGFSIESANEIIVDPDILILRSDLDCW